MPPMTLSRTFFYAHARPRLRQTNFRSTCTGQHARRRPFSSSPPSYATHRDTPASSLLTQTLDQRDRSARNNSHPDSVGPFQFGTQATASVKESDLKRWNQLDTKEKMKRTAQRTTNVTVILFGAGFTALLAYALTSELFARNSPTVLYGNACERIKASDKVAQYLRAPFSFHNNPPSAVRPRHRNRHVSYHHAVDSAGREHLLLNFYVRGAPAKSGSPTSLLDLEDDDDFLTRYVKRGWRGVQGLTETSWDEAVTWIRGAATSAKERGRRLFLYLIGEPVPATNSGGAGASAVAVGGIQTPSTRRESKIGRTEVDGGGSGLWASVAGLFSGIGRARGVAASHAEEDRPYTGEMYDEGEVHADLVKNADGNFEWRYLIIDMPNSRVYNPRRVFVVRRDDVLDGEGIMRWF